MQFPRPFALALTFVGIAAAGALFYAGRIGLSVLQRRVADL